jgi:hypothetical protein
MKSSSGVSKSGKSEAPLGEGNEEDVGTLFLREHRTHVALKGGMLRSSPWSRAALDVHIEASGYWRRLR